MDLGVQPSFWTHPYWISLSRIGSTPCLASLTLEVKPCETIDLFFWHQVPVFLIIVPFNLPFTWGTFQTNPIFGGSHGTMGGWVTSPSCFRQGCVEANILKRLNSLFDSDDTLGRRVGSWHVTAMDWSRWLGIPRIKTIKNVKFFTEAQPPNSLMSGSTSCGCWMPSSSESICASPSSCGEPQKWARSGESDFLEMEVDFPSMGMSWDTTWRYIMIQWYIYNYIYIHIYIYIIII